MNQQGETDIELVKGGKANDDNGIRTLCLDVAKKDGEANKNVYKENVGGRRAQSADEEDPRINLKKNGWP